MSYILALYIVALGAASSQGCGDLEIVPRSSWGARSQKGPTEILNTPVDHTFIHHTALEECSDFHSCCQNMRAIQDLHMDTRGWNDIGYNFVIGGDGRVYISRGWTTVGAHTLGYNSKAIGFSLMGDFSFHEPSEIMLNTTNKLIQCALQKKYIKDDYKLHGHRDSCCTECPGDAFYNLIKNWPHFEAGPLPDYYC
ncbi:peptidoglycan-recognition protein SB1-like isoform X1 [Stegodyphus dumicola]|uniref:peptidoglycan-recognition protein SB1-like isoform X1 n=1 Tax=Stegodyphus dumicola TaxID=202533 RepID=UPI0015AC6F1F|nr:peptidoglycan-recognition protein SB1-like isoform X1 [Stegodyphus dumicola]